MSQNNLDIGKNPEILYSSYSIMDLHSFDEMVKKHLNKNKPSQFRETLLNSLFKADKYGVLGEDLAFYKTRPVYKADWDYLVKKLKSNSKLASQEVGERIHLIKKYEQHLRNYRRKSRNLKETVKSMQYGTKNQFDLAKQFEDDRFNIETSFRSHEKVFSKFDTLRVELTFKPTSDHEVVKNIMQKYINSKFDVMKGRKINIVLCFKETHFAYRSGEFIVDKSEDINTKIDSTLAQWMFDSQGYEGGDIPDDEEEDVDKETDKTSSKILFHAYMIRLYVSLNAGGCLNSQLSFKGMKTRTLHEKIWIPHNSDNNCAIYCVSAFVNARFTKTGLVKVNVLNEDAKIVKNVREVYYNGDKPIPYDRLKAIADYYKVDIEVYQFENESVKKIKNYYFNYENVCRLLLINGHYCLITVPSLILYTKCKKCREFVLNMDKHFENCKRCNECGEHFTGKHTVCHMSSSREKIIEKNSVEENFNALENIIYADFETINENAKLKVYAVGYSINDDEPTILKGKESLNQFLDFLIKLNENAKKKTRYTLVFYNGSRFDLYFLYKQLIKRNILIKKTIYSDGAYKSLTFNGISAFDLNLHIQGSLKANCRAFGVAEDKVKGDFNHMKIKDWNCVDEYENEWSPYLRQDIVSMRELYKIYAKSVWDDWSLNINKYITLSSMAFKAWKTMLSAEQKVKLLDYETDCFVRRSIYGGRCYPQKQYFESKGEGDYLLDIDVVSLYPTAMGKPTLEKSESALYPTGEHAWIYTPIKLDQIRDVTNKLSYIDHIKYFIAECDIETNKKLVTPAIPRRDDKGFLQWDLHDIQKGVYTSVDLIRAVNHGYKITKIHRLVKWNKSTDLYSNYIEKCFELKKKAKKDTPQYTIAKLMMNALYGKMIQAPITEKSKLVYNLAELNEIREQGQILDMRFLTDDLLLVHYQPYAIDESVTKPSYVGAFILSNSRVVMDKYIDAIDGYNNLETSFYRTDTDSLIIHNSVLPKVQHLIGKELGCIDFDIQGKIVKFAEVCPKVYCCEYIGNDGKIHTHTRAKGFSKEDQQKLVFQDFKNMLFGGKSKNETVELKDGYGNNKGKIIRNGDQIMLNIDSKLKKVGFNVNSKQLEKGYEFSNIVSECFSRTLNKTKWEKRIRIADHPNLGSLPIGYEY